MDINRKNFLRMGGGLAAIIAAKKSPAIVRSLVGARSSIVEKTKLPYDAEVEYLESTGTQWIDTGINPQNAPTIVADMQILNSLDRDYFGNTNNRVGGESLLIANFSSYWLFYYRYASPYAVKVDYQSQGNREIWSIGKEVSVDGVLKYASPNTYVHDANQTNIFIFKSGRGNASTFRLFSFKLYDGSFLVRDMIPVRFTNELGQSEGAMYDRVSRKLFRNQGTGSFVIGRDINPISARSYVNDGLIAMWDGIENAGWGVHDANATSWKDLVSGQSSEAFQSTEEVSDNAVFTTTRKLVLMNDVEATANNINTLTVQRVAQEMKQSVNNNAACSIGFCPKRFGVCMYFRHAGGGNGHGPMGYSFAPEFGAFGNEYYNPSDTYPLNSRTMIVGANNNPISGYEGDYELSPYGKGLTWGGTSNDVSAFITSSTSGKYKNCCIRIYNRALTADEIAINNAIDKQRFKLP